MFLRIILMRIILRRIDVERIKKAFPWVMVYGRRKTGKTFLVENFIEHDKFFFVNRDSTVLDKSTDEVYTYEEFRRVFRESMEIDATVVIDEFHRLPESFQDYLHAMGVKGKLILITSTLWLAKRLLGRKKPLLGTVTPVRVSLIDEMEVMEGLRKHLKGRELVEASTYLREVILIPKFTGKNMREFLSDFLFESRIVIKNLVGEIFTEEERKLTNVYEGIMKAVSNGKNVSTEISSFLFSRGLIAKDNPGVVQKYLNTLVEVGILERLKVFDKKKYRYFHASPLLDLHYYLEAKYSYTEVETPKSFIRKVVEQKLPFHVEQYFRNFMSKYFGMQPAVFQEKDLEVDILLLKFKKPKVVVEVKWKDKVSETEVKSVERKLQRFEGCKKILVVPSRSSLERIPESVEVWDVDYIVKNCLKKRGNRKL